MVTISFLPLLGAIHGYGTFLLFSALSLAAVAYLHPAGPRDQGVAASSRSNATCVERRPVDGQAPPVRVTRTRPG